MNAFGHQVHETHRKIRARLALVSSLVYRRSAAIPPLSLRLFDHPIDPPEALAAVGEPGWTPVAPYTYWGRTFQDFALLGQFSTPADGDRNAALALHLPLGDAGAFSHPEATVTIDGAVVATADRHHQEVPLPARYADGQPHQLLLTGWTGILSGPVSDRLGQLMMRPCSVVEIDGPTREFVAAARTALDGSQFLDDLTPVRSRLLNALDAAFARLDLREPFGDAFYASVREALPVLRAGIAEAGPPLDAEVIAVGHAHIDVAWLWTLAHTRRKASRTFRTALALMDAFPAFHFTQSQPQLYRFIEEDEPALFEEIRRQVKARRWEPIGGMWVESDCNVTGAESLARQFLLGRSYFRQHFGKDADSPVLWLPDVFGYSWSLPQLIKLAGLDYFFTIKIGWNKVNTLPVDSFWWQGLDGTKVLTHFSTAPSPKSEGGGDLRSASTYNAELDGFTALGAWVKLKHKDTQRTLLAAYGMGDGGGGPTREMNENAAELREFPGMPKVKQGTVREFFERLARESGDRLPTWNGELYLEIHRGTYTTQSRTKRDNRKAEFLLHDAEFLAAWAARLDPNYAYPTDTFTRCWQTVCLNQFHDIIPGSSIAPVYAESRQQYAEVMQTAGQVRDGALAVVTGHLGGDVVLINPTSFGRDDLAFWPDARESEIRLAGVCTQAVEGGVLIGGAWAPAYGAVILTQGEPLLVDPREHPLFAEPTRLENKFLCVELNPAGDIVRIRYREREILPPGAVGNQWQAFEDRPLYWDAWDVDIFYEEKMYLAEPATSVRVVESGPLRATLEVKRRILHSEYVQRISLTYDSPVLQFDTWIDWRERHILLKAAFPVDILSPVATHEIQWGSIQRPTHRNTSWDWARFETAAQKWVDLSEGNFGVALLNDCKYGHDIHDNVIRISLLRSPTEPDPEADQGEHRFTYSLFPHRIFFASTIASAAYQLNDPLIIRPGHGGRAAPTDPYIQAPPALIVETVKAAEDGRGTIVRLYECDRQRGARTIQFGFDVREAWITNLLEEDQEQLNVNGREVELHLRPFQIVTLRVV